MKTLGTYDLKTLLSEILDEVEKGETIMITRRGNPVAVLSPAPRRPRPIKELIEEMRKIRERQPSMGPINVKDLMEEGRRF